MKDRDDRLFENLTLVREAERKNALERYELRYEDPIICNACRVEIINRETAYKAADGLSYHDQAEYQETIEANDFFEMISSDDPEHPFYDGPYSEDTGTEGYKPWMR